MQKYRDVLLEVAHSDKSNLARALQKICSLSAATLDVARVSYWSVAENDSAISCDVLYLRDSDGFDESFKGSRLGFAQYPAYFEELAAKRPIIANHVLGGFRRVSLIQQREKREGGRISRSVAPAEPV